MAFTPENNPYIPGDPYSYDLKWVVGKINSWESVKEGAEQAVGIAQQSADNAYTNANKAEAWAIGIYEGEPVQPGEPQYENNAKYYAEQAGESAETAADLVDNVEDIQQEVRDDLSAQNTAIATLEGRMDAFTQLAEGSTTGDAELMDLRVGVDGKIYPTAGDAVRDQLSQIALRKKSIQLLDYKSFVEGYTLQNIDAVSTPDDLTANAALFVTNTIEFINPLTSPTNFAIRIDGVSRILSYTLSGGSYVRSGSYSSSNIITGPDYKYITIQASALVPIYKIRMSALITSNPNPENCYFCEESEWSSDLDLNYYNYMNIEGYIKPDHILPPVNPAQYNGNDVRVFFKGIAIGDSLTEGTFNTIDGFEVHEQYAYPMCFYKKTGVTLRNFGVGGATAQSWYERYQNVSFPAYDFAIIALGVNDILQNVSNTTTINYINSIVTKLQSVNPDTKCFISTLNKAYQNEAGWSSLNTAIRTYAEGTTNCYLLDIAEYGATEPGTPYVDGHLTAIGYNKLADEYANIISSIVANNLSDFTQIQFSGTTYTDLPTD